MSDPDAVVVGSGPNGLAAAVTLARAGRSVTVLEARDQIGGGTRSAELTVPGVLHDVCSASHPFAAASPFLSELDLDAHGLEWRFAEIELAHPLDGGRAAAMVRSLDETASNLRADARVWRRTFEPLVRRFSEVSREVLRPMLHVPRHPVALGRFGLRALLPASALVGRFEHDEARGLFAGAAAHVFRPLDRPLTSSVGLVLLASGHAVGWPVARGGSHSITKALASLLSDLGGTIETGVEVRSLADVPPAAALVLDTSPEGALRILGDEVPRRTARSYRRWKRGPAAFKLDLAVEGGIPWTSEVCRRAGVVHVGGTFEEIAAAEAEMCAGRMPERPFMLVGQQYLCDPDRSAGDTHPIWAYAHVPNGYDGDATEAMLDQFERFAPGTRDRIVGKHVMTPADFEAANANFAGGDISTGANTARQLVLRPRPTLRPYSTGRSLTYLCSAATPPGAGTHGMCGHLAAKAALRDLERAGS